MAKRKIEFLRFNQSGAMIEIFSYSPVRNPEYQLVLMQGDVIRINQSIASGIELLNEIATPVIGIKSLFRLLSKKLTNSLATH